MSLIVAGGIKNYGEGTMEHELLNGRRGIGPDGKAWHLDTDTYERLMNMQFYRGAFATPEDLKVAHPSDIIGSYAIVLSTETFWIWVVEDAYTGWVDTHASVTEVSGLPPGGSTGQVLAKASDIDNDVVWVNQTGGGGGPISGNHNDLSGLQGGNNTERFHMTGYQHNVVSAIVAGKPTQPINLSPIDGAVDVIELETFESSPYANAFGSPMYGYQLQVIASNGTVVYDSGNVETTSVQYRIPSGKLTVTTNYTWRVRYQAGNLNWSDWSEPTGFKTVDDFSAFIVTPSLLRPSQGDVLNSPYPTLITTPFEATAGIIQTAGDFEISASSDFSNVVDSGSGMNIFTGTQALTRGVPYWARARHKATNGATSAFSFPHHFIVRNLFREQRIGIALIDENSWVFQRIDRDYMPVDIDGDYWTSNTIWAGWEASLNRDSAGAIQYTDVFGQKMFVMPSFWINSGKIPTGPYEGKRFWMIDTEVPSVQDQEHGWHKHSMFAHPDGGYQDSVFVSGYLISNASNVAVSSGTNFWNGSVSTAETIINARNTSMANTATRGWRPLPYYFTQGFLLLALLEGGNLETVKNLVVGGNYRGFRAWQTGVGWGFYIKGLFNGFAMMPGFGQNISLAKNILPPDWVSAGGSTNFAKITGFWSSEDGINPLLRFDDYLIGKYSEPSVISTTTQSNNLPYGDIPIRVSNGVGNTSQQMIMGGLGSNMYNQYGALSLGSEVGNANSSTAMMVKYD